MQAQSSQSPEILSPTRTTMRASSPCKRFSGRPPARPSKPSHLLLKPGRIAAPSGRAFPPRPPGAAFPYGCFAVIEVAPAALPQTPDTRPACASRQLTRHARPPGPACGTRSAGSPNPGAWNGLPSSHAPGGYQSGFLVTPFGTSSWPRHHPFGPTTRTPLPCSVPVAIPMSMGLALLLEALSQSTASTCPDMGRTRASPRWLYSFPV